MGMINSAFDAFARLVYRLISQTYELKRGEAFCYIAFDLYEVAFKTNRSGKT